MKLLLLSLLLITASFFSVALSNTTAFAQEGVTPSNSDTTTPTTPTNLKAQGLSSSQISLTWIPSKDNKGVAGYKIYREGAQAGSSTTNNFIDKDLKPYTTYSYVIRSFDAAGNISNESDKSFGTTLSEDADSKSNDQNSLLPPTNVSGQVINFETVIIQWSQNKTNSLVKEFQIHRNGEFLTKTTETSFVDPYLEEDTYYQYAITSVDRNGKVSERSDTLSLKTSTKANSSLTTQDLEPPKIVAVYSPDGKIIEENKPILRKNQSYSIQGTSSPNSTVVATFHSNPFSYKVPTDKNGSWELAFSNDLDLGDHNLTLSVVNQDAHSSPTVVLLNFTLTSDGKKDSFPTLLVIAVVLILLALSYVIYTRIKKQKPSHEKPHR